MGIFEVILAFMEKGGGRVVADRHLSAVYVDADF